MIICKTEITERQFLRAHQLHSHGSRMRWLNWLVTAIMIIMIPVILIHFGMDKNGLMVAGILALMLILTPITSYAQKHDLKKSVRKLPMFGKSLEWKFDDQSISNSGEGFNTTESWSAMFSATIAPDGILIYPQQNLFYWIPADGFSSPDEFNALVEIVSSKIKKIKRVS